MIKRISISIVVGLVLLSVEANAQKPCYGAAVSKTAMNIWKDSFSLGKNPAKWTYDMGVVLEGVFDTWKQTGDPAYFNYVQQSIDFFVQEDGSIKTYKPTEFNIDHVKNGTSLLAMFQVTKKEKYWKAATLLREQLRVHPRTKQGGFWHKKIYPYQMWLDGLYMAQPFYTQYALLSHDDTAFNDIANQFIWMEQHARDEKTGLLYHGWDESKAMGWANKETGLSPQFWGRAIGWYAMALVDVLEYYPADHPKRAALVQILQRTIDGVEKVQDKKTGLWYDLINLPNEKGNYFEASASSMFVYAIAKGVRMGVLPANKIGIAHKGYKGILKTFIKKEDGQTNLHGTVKVSGLGGKPYRDGSIAYYLSEDVIVNDPKGVGSFIKAAVEMEKFPAVKSGTGKTILLDYYFNKEMTTDVTGKQIQHHYIWEEMSNGGYSFLGNIFNSYGVTTQQLTTAVSEESLKDAAIYFIIDPDWPKENKQPNYIEPSHIETIYNWVKEGGVLMLFANDSNNVEFTRYNQLASRFGIQFNERNPRNLVKGNDYATGTISIPKGNKIFKTAANIYVKEISTLSVQSPATTVLADKGDNIVAISKVGKGTVFAIGDPWLYNEYVDGRKLPANLENFKAAHDLVQWLIKQTN